MKSSFTPQTCAFYFVFFHFGVFLYLCVLFHLSFVHYVSFLDIFLLLVFFPHFSVNLWLICNPIIKYYPTVFSDSPFYIMVSNCMYILGIIKVNL